MAQTIGISHDERLAGIAAADLACGHAGGGTLLGLGGDGVAMVVLSGTFAQFRHSTGQNYAATVIDLRPWADKTVGDWLNGVRQVQFADAITFFIPDYALTDPAATNGRLGAATEGAATGAIADIADSSDDATDGEAAIFLLIACDPEIVAFDDHSDVANAAMAALLAIEMDGQTIDGDGMPEINDADSTDSGELDPVIDEFDSHPNDLVVPSTILAGDIDGDGVDDLIVLAYAVDAADEMLADNGGEGANEVDGVQIIAATNTANSDFLDNLPADPAGLSGGHVNLTSGGLAGQVKLVGSWWVGVDASVAGGDLFGYVDYGQAPTSVGSISDTI